jgi:hypothetical protein
VIAEPFFTKHKRLLAGNALCGVRGLLPWENSNTWEQVNCAKCLQHEGIGADNSRSANVEVNKQ